jgi:AraC family transcriptional regulator
MEARIENSAEKKFIGKRLQMSFSNNKTFKLWSSFMPRRKEISNSIGKELYSIEIYNPAFLDNSDPDNIFEKWAAMEVSDFQFVPAGMEKLVTPEGLYAVFLHKGPASEGPKTYQYIFQSWLSNSKYELDNRPHFAIMGEKYKNEDPASEEELWIPIRPK